MAVSLKDHKDTQVSATTFIHTLVYTYEVQEGITAHCQSPHRHHGRQGLCSTDGAPPSNQFVHAETVVRQSQHSIEEPHPAVSSQLVWTECAGSSVHLGGRTITHCKASLIGRESPSGKERRMQGESF
jgi:hypothetical protein